MKKYLTVVAFFVIILVAVSAVNLFNTTQRQKHQQEHDKAEAIEMGDHLRQANDDVHATKMRIVLKSLQLEKSGVKRKDLAKALSGEEAQAQKELHQKLQSLQMDERR